MNTLTNLMSNILANNFQKSLIIHPVPRCDVVVSFRHLVSRSTTIPIMQHPSHHRKLSEVVGNRRLVIVVVVVSRGKNGGLCELGWLELLLKAENATRQPGWKEKTHEK